MTFDSKAFSIQIRKISVDGEIQFKGSVTELPHLATYEDTAEDAYRVLTEDIEALHASAVELGHPFPEPAPEADGEYSGRLTVRLPRTLHRTLDGQAIQEGVSLNSYVANLLTQGATCRDVTAQASASIKAVAKTAIITAVLMRGQEGDPGDITAGYSKSSQIQIPKQEEKWTAPH